LSFGIYANIFATFFLIYEVNILLAFSRWCVFLYFPVIVNCDEKINDDTICTGCLLPILKGNHFLSFKNAVIQSLIFGFIVYLKI